MPQLAIIADDMTGAADAGAVFTRAGLTVILALSGVPLPPSDVLITSTESRHLSPAAARAGMTRAARWARDARWIYKKIDSTLRGNAGVELAALLTELGAARCLVAPAFPAQGRTTRGGRQMVNGVALERTPFAVEAPGSDLCALFAEAGTLPCRLISLEVVRRGPGDVCAALALPGICVADAETDGDLDTLAEAVERCDVRVCCGSAGLAGALAGRLPLRRLAVRPTLPPRGEPVFVVAGSRSERTLRQVQVAAAAGAMLVAPDARFMDSRSAFAGVVEEAARCLAAGRPAILTTVALPESPLGAEAVAGRLAEAARAIAERCAPGRLVLTGGDVAGAVFRTLEAQALWLRGEVEPGVPWATIVGGMLSGATVVTKAGGFGGDGTIAAAMSFTLAENPNAGNPKGLQDL